MEKDDALSMTSHLCGTEEWVLVSGLLRALRIFRQREKICLWQSSSISVSAISCSDDIKSVLVFAIVESRGIM